MSKVARQLAAQRLKELRFVRRRLLRVTTRRGQPVATLWKITQASEVERRQRQIAAGHLVPTPTIGVK